MAKATHTAANFRRDLAANKVRGRVIDIGDAEYRTIIDIDNGRISHEPLVIVVAEDEADVANVVKFAAKRRVPLAVKCGGHGAAGYCLRSDGIVLDIRNLRKMELDRSNGLLRMGMGLRWRSVYDFMETSGTGYIPIGGGCPDVGVGGFLLGGGYSFVSRSYGLGSDNIQSLRVVDAAGKFHDLDASSTGDEADLYWALRGAGGGNLAVAVEATIQTQRPNSPSLLVGQFQFAMHQIDDVLPRYDAWVQNLPQEMAVYGFIGHQADPRRPGERILCLRFTPVFNGDFAAGLKLLEPLVAMRPFSVSLNDMTMPEWEELIGSGTTVRGRAAYIRSLMFPKGAMTAKVAKIFKRHFARCPSEDSFMVWTHAGGKIAEVKADATGFFHRDALFVPEIKSIWDRSKPDLARANIEWAHAFFEDLAPHATGAYLNYIDPLLSDWPNKYYGSNYSKLKTIKECWDPHGVFAFQQGIGSSFSPSGGIPIDLSPL